MDIQMADVTVHIDENLSGEQRETIEESVRALEGVLSFHNADTTPHLATIEYNPDVLTPQDILKRVTNQGVHAELIGL